MVEAFTDCPIELIDFGAENPSARLTCAERVVHGGVGVSRCVLDPNPGVALGAAQFTVAVHDSAPFDMEWQLPESGHAERRRIVAGEMHINAADRPILQRWSARPRILAIALERPFVEQVARDAFDEGGTTLRTVMATRDPMIESMATVWRRELAEGGAGGQLYTESLGTALAVHLLRNYGDGVTRLRPVMGGLGALRLRRVIDYAEAHLSEDVSLDDLAQVAGLSTHHFAEAFKVSTGRPPHRYLTERRIHRAKTLLLGNQRSVAEVALTVGFASHSHFTVNFRKATGTTPSRFRLDRS